MRQLQRATRPALAVPRDLLMAALAEKALGAWMANRHQTLFPLAMNFRRLSAAQVELLVGMIATALLAGGRPFIARQWPQMRGWLRTVGGDDALADRIAASVAAPPQFAALLEAIEAERLAPYAYSVSLACLDHRVLANRLFLEYIAARLAVPSDMARSLAQRFRS